MPRETAPTTSESYKQTIYVDPYGTVDVTGYRPDPADKDDEPAVVVGGAAFVSAGVPDGPTLSVKESAALRRLIARAEKFARGEAV